MDERESGSSIQTTVAPRAPAKQAGGGENDGPIWNEVPGAAAESLSRETFADDHSTTNH